MGGQDALRSAASSSIPPVDNNEEDYDEKVDEKTLEKVADSQES